MNLVLAPLHGFTDATFRNVYFSHFEGIDSVVAPFISLTRADKITAVKVRELARELNQKVELIPQILGNDAKDFILLSHYLYEQLGYEEVNWNLGCPIRSIVSKKRGSGLLPYPDLLERLLNEIVPGIPQKLSVKMRLGMNNVREFPPLARVLNQFPVRSITLHPRLGVQQYEGSVLLDDLEQMIPLLQHKLIYNGDIRNIRDLESIRQRFPGFEDFMIGRGIFSNPFLPEQVKSLNATLPDNSTQRFINFYYELEAAEKHSRKLWMSKMKEYWKYFSVFLNLPDTVLLEILRCESVSEWNKLLQSEAVFSGSYQ